MTSFPVILIHMLARRSMICYRISFYVNVIYITPAQNLDAVVFGVLHSDHTVLNATHMLNARQDLPARHTRDKHYIHNEYPHALLLTPH